MQTAYFHQRYHFTNVTIRNARITKLISLEGFDVMRMKFFAKQNIPSDSSDVMIT